MLTAGIAEQHPELAEQCLQESLYFASSPFVEALRQAPSPQRVAAILRLLRDRAGEVPELDELCVGLAQSPDAETRGFAREILVRRGRASPSTGSSDS